MCLPVFVVRCDLSASALDRHRDSHAAADAKRCQAFFGIATRHFVKQRDQYPAT
jgi:hypothetical protein